MDMRLSECRTKFVDKYCLKPNAVAPEQGAGYAALGARVSGHRLPTNA